MRGRILESEAKRQLRRVPLRREGGGCSCDCLQRVIYCHALAPLALGLAPSPLENGAARESAELSSHVVYGVATEVVRRIFDHVA